MVVSNTLKRRFVKDTGIPICIFEDKYWDYFLNLYDKYYDSKRKWSYFLNVYSYCDSNEEKFFEMENNIIQNAVEKIKNTPEYEDFNKSNFEIIESNLPPDKNLYISDNNEKRFISIDLIKANYNVLRRYNSKLVLDTLTYEDFIKKFTIYVYFIQSKQIRQVIFGNLNPKKIRTLQKKIMIDILNFIQNDYYKIPTEDIYSLSSDEIIIVNDLNKNYSDKNYMEKLKESMNAFNARVNSFTLKKLGDYDFYMKEFDDGRIEFKGIPNYFIPQVIKHITGEDLNAQDMLFYFENLRCRFDEPLIF